MLAGTLVPWIGCGSYNYYVINFERHDEIVLIKIQSNNLNNTMTSKLVRWGEKQILDQNTE